MSVDSSDVRQHKVYLTKEYMRYDVWEIIDSDYWKNLEDKIATEAVERVIDNVGSLENLTKLIGDNHGK